MPPFEWIFHAAAFLALFWSAGGYPTQKFFATEPVKDMAVDEQAV